MWNKFEVWALALPIRTKLIWGTLLAVIITNMLLVVIMNWRINEQSKADFMRHSLVMAELTAEVVLLPVAQADSKGIASQVRSLLGDPSIQYIVVVDRSGVPVFTYDPLQSMPGFSVDDSGHHWWVWNGLEMLDSVITLNGDGQFIGKLKIGFQRHSLEAQYTLEYWFLMLVVSLAVLLAYCLVSFIQRWVMQPVLVLEQYVRQFAEDPAHWQEQIPLSHDEMGRLYAAFNQLAQRIDERNKELGLVRSELEKKILERTHELTKAKEVADADSKAKSEFLANMSHEIRTPLTAVVGFLYLLSRTSLDQIQREYMARIDVAAKSLLAVIQDILDFSKIEASRMELEVVEFSLRDVCDKVVATIGCEALNKNIHIELDVHEAVPDNLLGDPLRLSQILINLGNNAVKFTQRGMIFIAVDVESVERESFFLRFAVKDTGIGLFPEQVQKLFQPFTQADASTTRKFGGTGLGLAICQRLVEMMQGKIGVESLSGVGSTFFFTVALRQGQGAMAQSLPTHVAKTTDTIPQTEVLRDFRLLLVEDNVINQILLRELLEQEGATVDVAGNGVEALAQIQHPGKIFDAVLMDIQMPQMGGIETTRRIRAYPGMADLPIIAMTAHARDEDSEKCLAAGMNDYCLKPIDVPALMEKLVYWIRRFSPVREAHSSVSEHALPKGLCAIDFADLSLQLDVDDGVARCGGGGSRYAELLKLFLVNYRDFPVRATTLYESRQWTKLEKAALSLRGVAGNLGARELSDAAKAFQLELEQPEKQSRQLAFDRFLDCTHALLSALVLWESRQPSDAGGWGEDSGAFQSVEEEGFLSLDVLLDRLTDALASHDLEADAVWLRLRQVLPHSGKDPLLIEVEQAIRSLDYADALRKLHRWKRHTL